MRHELLSNGTRDEAVRAETVTAQLDHLSQQIEIMKKELSSASVAGPTSRQLKQLLKGRRGRETYFGGNLFADPAWDILLQAYVAKLDQERMSISALCLAAEVPATTALRWINNLEQKGWLVRHDDPLDGRRSWIELSAIGIATMERYFASISGSVVPL